MTWSIISLRYTLFTEKPTTLETAQGLWKSFSGNNEYKLSHDSIKNNTVIQGSVNNGQEWKIGSQLDKLDFILPEPNIADFNKYGLYKDNLVTYQETFFDWLESSELQYTRLAFAPVLAYETKEVTEAYNILRQYLPNVLIPEKSTDFRLKINLPNKYNIQEKSILVNQLTDWQVLKFSFQNIKLPPVNGTIVSETPLEKTVVHLVCDINTSVENVIPFKKEKIIPIFLKFNEIVDQIITNGPYNV